MLETPPRKANSPDVLWNTLYALPLTVWPLPTARSKPLTNAKAFLPSTNEPPVPA